MLRNYFINIRSERFIVLIIEYKCDGLILIFWFLLDLGFIRLILCLLVLERVVKEVIVVFFILDDFI